MDETRAMRVWDAVSRRGAVRSAEAVAALRDVDVDRLWDVPIADLDRALLVACRAETGGMLDVEARCSTCAADLDLAVDLDTMLSALPTAPLPSSLRAPTTRALVSAEDADDPADSLWRWCAEASTEDPPLDRAAATSALNAAAPLLAPEISTVCPVCEAAVELALDPADALAELCEARVSALLREVLLLARSTGWAERDILSMTARRRRRYLELLDA